MSIVQLKSGHKDFSFIINKNPNTNEGLMAKSLKKGMVFGYYTDGDPTEYNIYFKDGADEVSFPGYEGQEYEYLNLTRYNSASFVVSAINDVLRSAFKSARYKTLTDEHTDMGGNESTFTIELIRIRNTRYIDSFAKHFKWNFDIKYEQIQDRNYRVTISTKKSIYSLLNISMLFAIFQTLINDEPLEMNDQATEKYIECMNNVEAPYFVRYLFKKQFLRNHKLFNKVKKNLDVTPDVGGGISMVYGDTWKARQMAIQERLSFDNNILDVGCGEGKYITMFNRFMKGNKYFAVDINDELRERTQKKIDRKGIKDVEFFKDTDSFLEYYAEDKGVDVICTEVIEHMIPEQAEKLVSEMLQVPNIKSLILTTPDVRFNENYFLEGMRHDDHKFEWTNEEFVDFVTKCLKDEKRAHSVKWFGIGDIVNEITPSQGIIIKFD